MSENKPTLMPILPRNISSKEYIFLSSSFHLVIFFIYAYLFTGKNFIPGGINMDNNIMIKDESGIIYDKMQLALAIRNSTYSDKFQCSLLNNGILNCQACPLHSICKDIDEAAHKYFESTTTTVKTFDVK